LNRLAADTLSRRIGRDEIGKTFFQVEQLVIERVVFAVGNDRPVLNIIGAVMPSDLVGQFGVPFLGFDVRHAESLTSRR